MAGGARTFQPVGIDAPDSSIGPGRRVELAHRQYLDFRPVALPASVDRGGGRALGERRRLHAAVALDDFRKHVVERPEDSAGLGVVRADELRHLPLVAARAVLWRYDHRDCLAFVLVCVLVFRVGGVAFIAADVPSEVGARPPLLVQGRYSF